jgi:hypothetical protein
MAALGDSDHGGIQLEERERFEAKTPILNDTSVDISPTLVPILQPVDRIPSTEPLANASPSHAAGGHNGYGSVGASPHSSSHYTIPAHNVGAKRRVKIRNGQHQLYEVLLCRPHHPYLNQTRAHIGLLLVS